MDDASCGSSAMSGNRTSPSRRSLLSMIGVVAGSAAMYHAMTELGYAEGSTFTGPIKLSPPPPGTTVLGAGVAGMVAAMLWTALQPPRHPVRAGLHHPLGP
jgi:hypothetical protein